MFRRLGRFGVRAGVAAGLALLVAGIVVVARLASDTNASSPRVASTFTTPTVGPTIDDDGPSDPSPSSFPDEAVLRTRAKDFVRTWLRQDLSAAAWHAAVTKLATSTLSESLKGVDPTTVPATRIVGEVVVRQRTEAFALVATPVDTGTVTLTLLKQDQEWLVDGVDWDRV